MKRSARRSLAVRGLAVVVVALGCLAPTPGDVGGCNSERALLDQDRFFATKAVLDCERCTECRLGSNICRAACDDSSPPRQFPEDCAPLVHDGAVCLRALADASCSDYRRFTNDAAPEAPTECNFCPPRSEP